MYNTSHDKCFYTIGPPLTPQPNFHVVNATHIKILWDKPFALPEFDVRNYTLSTLNTSSESSVLTSETRSVSQDTDYPISHYISNGGDIPLDCAYLNFSLTATSDAGTSTVGHVIGGFAIGTYSVIHNNFYFTSYTVFLVTLLVAFLYIYKKVFFLGR